MDFFLCKVTLGQIEKCHCQRALVNALHIPSHASNVQYVQINEYFLIRNCMAIKKLYQFFYCNKYVKSVKRQEINMGPSKCTIQCRLFGYPNIINP
jgi:hypothetical protein